MCMLRMVIKWASTDGSGSMMCSCGAAEASGGLHLEQAGPQGALSMCAALLTMCLQAHSEQTDVRRDWCLF